MLALLPFTWLAARFSDVPQFGKYQDDGLFLVSAKALTDSEGYRISSLPGKPFQTKYQPLYPWLLSLIWWIDGAFPGNLRIVSLLGWAITVTCLASIYWLARAAGFHAWASTGIAAFLAISPWLVYWALLPVSDFLFCGLVATVFRVFYAQPESRRWWWIAGALAGAAVLTKLVGVILVPAIWLGNWRRRHHWRALVTTAPAVLAFAGWLSWAGLHRNPQQNSVMWYYTDYLAFHIRNGGVAALPEIVQSNALSLVSAVGNSVLYNLADTMLGAFLCVVIFAGAISGTWRLVRRTGSVEYPAFCVLSVAILLAFNGSPTARLMSAVMPLLAMALWEEGTHVYRMIARSVRQGSVGRALALVAGAGAVAACAAAATLNVHFIVTGIPQLLERDRAALLRAQHAFEWCRRTLPANSVVLAENDTFLYLYGGLSAVRPVPSSIAFYTRDEAAQMENFTHFDRLADTFGVTHIVVTPDDFGLFAPAQRELIRRMLLGNVRHRQIYASRGTAVLEIQRTSRPAEVGYTRGRG